MRGSISTGCGVLLLMAVLATPASAQSPPPAPDLPALTIRPTDLDQSGWLHQGAFVHSVADAARDRADYIGQGADSDEVAERLTSIGWQREYVSFLSHPSKADPSQPDQVIRSYVTEYTNADGARAGFEFLEDESTVAAAKDLPLNQTFGQQSELTSERGFSSQTGRQFRSLDLTFRMGALIAGVNVIQYPTAERVDPDIDLLKTLATTMENRIAESPVIDSALGARVVRMRTPTPRWSPSMMPTTGLPASTSHSRVNRPMPPVCAPTPTGTHSMSTSFGRELIRPRSMARSLA